MLPLDLGNPEVSDIRSYRSGNCRRAAIVAILRRQGLPIELAFRKRMDLFVLRNHLRFLFADYLLLSLNFVQEHRVKYLILHRLNLAIGKVGREIRVDFGNFFCDEAVLDGLGAIGKRFLVAEGDRTELHQAVARVAHVLNVFFVATGGTDRAQLTIRIDEDGNGIVHSRSNATHPGYEKLSLCR